MARLRGRVSYWPASVLAAAFFVGLLTGQHGAAAQEEASDSVQLPGKATGIVAGGGGRLLIAHIKSAGKLAIVDAASLKIVKLINAPADMLYAAGSEHLLILDRAENTIQRWNLQTFEKEATAPSGMGAVSAMAMGCATKGPAVCMVAADRISSGRSLTLFDPATMKNRKLPVRRWSGPSLRGGELATMSAKGNALTVHRSRSFPGATIIELAETGASGAFRMDTSPPATLSGAGEFLASSSGILPRSKWPAFALRALRSNAVYFAAVRGPFYAQMTPGSSGASVDVYVWRRTKPALKLLTVAGIPKISARTAAAPGAPASQRFWLLPLLDRIVVLSASSDRLQAFKLDLKKAASSKGADYFFVDSVPPSQAAAGQLYQHQFAVQSFKPASFSLSLSPPGMTVSPSGLLKWSVPADHPGGRIGVVVSIESGKTHFHTFQVTVSAGSTQKPDATAAADSPAIERSLTASAPAITPVKFKQEQFDIPLPSNIGAAKAAGGGRYLLLHLKEINRIAVFDICNARIAKYLPAPNGEFSFAGGLTSAVVYEKATRRLTRWSLIDFESERSEILPKAIDQVEMGAASRGPVFTLTGRYSDRSVGFIDLATFKELPVRSASSVRTPSRLRVFPAVSVSGDGNTIASCRDGSKLCAVLSYSNGVVVATSRSVHMPQKSSLTPLADGSMVAGPYGQYTRKLLPLKESETPGRSSAVAAASSPLFLSITPQGNSVHYGADAELIAIAPGLPLDIDMSTRYDPATLRYDQRVYFVPGAHAVAVLPAAGSKVSLVHFDFAAGLKSDAAVAYVTSRPPATASRQGYRYQVVTAGSSAVRYSLAAGPRGMKISPAGLITWAPPRTGGATTHRVIVQVSAGGREIFHTFQVALAAGDPWPGAFREWSLKDRSNTAEARIAGYDRGMLLLIRRDGRNFYEPLKRFSGADQQYVDKLLEPLPPKPPGAEAPPEPQVDKSPQPASTAG